MPCETPPQSLIDAIAIGLTEPHRVLTDGVMVAVDQSAHEDERFVPSHFIAAYVQGDGIEDPIPGLWAIGLTGKGSIAAVSGAARGFTDWGASLNDTKVAEFRDKWLQYPEASEALDCLKV